MKTSAIVLACLIALSATALTLVQGHGWTLWYGDAEAHLKIARQMVDSRTPGWEQVGTVWLPLPHILMLPLAGDKALFRSGLAGAIPSAICFTLGAWLFFLAIRRLFGSTLAGVLAAAVLATNPNLLYLQSTPMTEPVMLAALAGLLYATVAFRQVGAWRHIMGAGVASLAASLTRYEGWFLIPFVALYFLARAKRQRVLVTLVYCLIAAAGPAAWLGHNWWCTGDALDFYRGPYSPRAIQGGRPYPGLGDWGTAWYYYRHTVSLAAGWGACLVGLTGAAAAWWWKRALWPVFFLSLAPAFYVWSMVTSGGSPIYIPTLWPYSFYNSRYGLSALPILALGAGALVTLVPERRRAALAGAVVFLAVLPWLAKPRPEAWACWKESQVNSEARRAWTGTAANFLVAHYRPGTGIFSALGDQAGVFREAGIPFREVLQEGNGPAWFAAVSNPAMFLHEGWALAIQGDAVWRAVARNPKYALEKTIAVPGAKPVEIYRLN